MSAKTIRLIAGLLAIACITTGRTVLAQTPPAPFAPDVGDASAPWRNKALTPDARARDLLPRLTLAEKLSLVHQDTYFSVAPLDRFNIPRRWTSDGPNGVRAESTRENPPPTPPTEDFATAMSANVGLAASFDLDLAKDFGNVIGEEALVRGKQMMLGPGLNIMRTPLNGRNSEYFGEDPFLAARMGVAYIEAVQSHGVASCAKHYALNDQEITRNSVSAEVDDRTLHEIYLPAFKAAVTEAKVWTVMSGYNRFRGVYCSENDILLNQILKTDWKFQGLVVSDWGGVHSTVNAALHGMDLEMGTGGMPFLGNPLLAALTSDPPAVPMAKLNEMALRNLRVMAFTGLFDGPRPKATEEQIVKTGFKNPEHLAAARKIAEGSIVLLKNEKSLLPFDGTKIKSIAVIGYNANAKFAGNGVSAAIKTVNEVTPLEGLKARAGAGISVTYAQGFAGGGGGRGGRGVAAPAAPAAGAANLIEEAVAAAKAADVAVIVAGLYRGQDQEGNDRPNMNLPAGQAELIQAVLAANPRTVVVLNGGSASVVDPWINNANALVMYWYGGSEGGNALARLLFGDVNFSAHLPLSWPRQLVDSPAHSFNDPTVYPGTGGGGGGRGAGVPQPGQGPIETYKEGLYVGYRWFDTKKIEPQFPFGFGLSYTTFAFSDISGTALTVGALDPTQPRGPAAAASTAVLYSCTVSNTGPREGADVVQLYIEPLKPSVDRPLKELKAFTKIVLKPGEKKTATLPLTTADFAYYSPEKHAWIAEAGDYIIHIGDSSRSLPLQQTFHLGQTAEIPDAIR